MTLWPVFYTEYSRQCRTFFNSFQLFLQSGRPFFVRTAERNRRYIGLLPAFACKPARPQRKRWWPKCSVSTPSSRTLFPPRPRSFWTGPARLRLRCLSKRECGREGRKEWYNSGKPITLVVEVGWVTRDCTYVTSMAGLSCCTAVNKSATCEPTLVRRALSRTFQPLRLKHSSHCHFHDIKAVKIYTVDAELLTYKITTLPNTTLVQLNGRGFRLYASNNVCSLYIVVTCPRRAMAQHVRDEFFQIPIVTRVFTSACVLTTISVVSCKLSLANTVAELTSAFVLTHSN